MHDLRARSKKHEEQYETIEDSSFFYIKIFNLSSKLLVNQIYGRILKIIVHALMAWKIGSRPILFCRADGIALMKSLRNAHQKLIEKGTD
mmetsp:Transcript_52568/g.52935  ORF Transcript_52568/g.52935 Transcript_52568/m.52935 type:complete len:90 (+) Transcript_52568:802-1071(+)